MAISEVGLDLGNILSLTEILGLSSAKSGDNIGQALPMIEMLIAKGINPWGLPIETEPEPATVSRFFLSEPEYT